MYKAGQLVGHLIHTLREALGSLGLWWVGGILEVRKSNMSCAAHGPSACSREGATSHAKWGERSRARVGLVCVSSSVASQLTFGLSPNIDTTGTTIGDAAMPAGSPPDGVTSPNTKQGPIRSKTTFKKGELQPTRSGRGCARFAYTIQTGHHALSLRAV